jgi:hypothetical protein
LPETVAAEIVGGEDVKDLSAFGAELGDVLEGLRDDVDVLKSAEVKDGVVRGKMRWQWLVHINDMVGTLEGRVVERFNTLGFKLIAQEVVGALFVLVICREGQDSSEAAFGNVEAESAESCNIA